jgi:acyl-CoA thioesterase
MEKIKEYFRQKDAFARKCGIELLEVSKGTARASVRLTPEHLNGVGIAHGGIIFTLADYVFAVASNSHGTVAVAINANISYLKAAQEGVLFAQAREISCSRKIASYSIDVTNEQNDIIATFQGMVYRKDASIF